ncbi:MAG: hypothetical protein ACYDCK_07940 [Thermoplasmatota archaeon]
MAHAFANDAHRTTATYAAEMPAEDLEEHRAIASELLALAALFAFIVLAFWLATTLAP